MCLHDVAQILPSITPEALDDMPAVQVAQLRALAWAKTPGITPVKPGSSWVDRELACIDN